MMNRIKALFKTEKTISSHDLKMRPPFESAPQSKPKLKPSAKKFDDLTLPFNSGNYGIEVKEVSFVEFDRRKKPR